MSTPDIDQIFARNPILPGCNPDPAIARRGEEFYIATSTFEWLPAIEFHRSSNLRDWSLAGHAFSDDRLALRGVRESCGVWAPCLTVDPVDGRFFLAYSVMKSQSAAVFDVDNYVTWADEIEGPWADPVYVTSVGFDGSVFHDDDGSKWFITLEWEIRPGHEHPGWIVAQHLDPATGDVGEPIRIFYGTSDRGCLEAPHLYKIDGTYYLMTAEGGTGYGHGVCLARSKSLTGPYEADPMGAFLTSANPAQYSARGVQDFLRPEYYNPDAPMQKAGHGSLVQAPDGSWYVAHLASRPVPGTLACILGRETAIQAVIWDNGWLRLRDGGVAPHEIVPLPGMLPAPPQDALGIETDFNGGLPPSFVVPRVAPSPSWLRTDGNGLLLRGRDSLHSCFDVSLVATRRRAFAGSARTKVDFAPTHFRQEAGLSVYYNASNFAHLRITWSEELASPIIGIRIARSGADEDAVLDERPIRPAPVELRVEFDGKDLDFSYRQESGNWVHIGGLIDGSFLSDDVAVGFTGQFIGLSATDALRQRAEARFAGLSIRYETDPDAPRLREELDGTAFLDNPARQ